MKRTFITLLLMCATLPLAAQRYGEDLALTLWNNASAPHSNGLTDTEVEEEPYRLAYTTEAALYIFKADPAQDLNTAVVICPGGGYSRLAMDHEGYQLAQWFAANGITAAVLKYRMPNGHPEVPLEDAVQAVRILSGAEPGAEDFVCGYVGIVGSSAGGHLAAMTSTLGATRPDFSILFYPVITGEEGWCHRGSFDNLLGEARTAGQTADYSLENRVDSLTPPTLLLLCDDDDVVPSVSSSRYYNALKNNGIPASMHIWPTGGHGWGIRDHIAFKAQWQEVLLEWLAGVPYTD